MKVTFVLKDLSDAFYQGHGSEIPGLLNMVDMEKFEYLNKHRHDLGIAMKIGSGQFRDQVELNRLLRTNPPVAFSLEPRRGYRLATFEFSR